MKTISWTLENGKNGCDIEGEIEVEDDATEEDIDAAVMSSRSGVPIMTDTKLQVDAWNERHKMGCRVMHRRDDGTVRFTKTRSRAAILSTDKTPVIWLENVIGCVALDRVTPIHFSQAAAIEQADIEANSRRGNPG